jgi:LysM repeat protein
LVSNSKDSPSLVKKALFYKPFLVKVSSPILLLSLLSFPYTVDAGLFSVLIPTTSANEFDLGRHNSQSIPLPEPIVIMPGNKSNLKDIALVVEGDALVSFEGPMGTTADVEELPEVGDVSVYVVRSGDTVDAIAKMFGVSKDTIYWANDIEVGKPLKVGTALIILPINGVQHDVKKGETLKGIAKKYSVDVEDIVLFNDLNENSVLTVGDSIIIPNGKEATPIKKGGTSKPKVTISSGSVLNTNGYFIRPISGGIRTQGRHGSIWRNGVDLASYMGAPVFAAADGVVEVAKSNGYNGGAGKYVLIKHPNGSRTMYAHLLDVTVSSGQSVSQGQVIGHLGSSGRSTGAHLHFEVSKGFSNPLISNPRYGL